jgi:hypothetical protein
MISIEQDTSGNKIKMDSTFINYFNTFRLNDRKNDLINRCSCPDADLHTPLYRKSSGKLIHQHVARNLHRLRHYKKQVRLFFKYREVCLDNDSNERIFTCKQVNYYEKMFTKKGISNDPINLNCVDYNAYAQNPYLLYLDINHVRDAVLELNEDFIKNIKYIPTPGIVRLASTIENIDYNLPKSAHIALSVLHGAISLGKFREPIDNNLKLDIINYLSSDRANIYRLKKYAEKEHDVKFDLRSTKNIISLIGVTTKKLLR